MAAPAPLTSSPASGDDVALIDPSVRNRGAREFVGLVRHLAYREITSSQRMTTLGWLWPITRQLAQLAVLVFVFSRVLDLGIPDFPVYVFSGLVAWGWFASSVSGASTCLLGQRHLLFLPRFPAAVVPVVAVAVPFVDLLMALPVLFLLLVLNDGIPLEAVFIPIPIVVQLVLMCGTAWLIAPAAVHFRDIPNITIVAVTLLFYLTPVFYGLRSVPEKYTWLLKLNPMTTVIETYRALLLGQPLPGPLRLVGVTVASVLVAVLGWVVMRRSERTLVDAL
jgi:lipopolysaccharide transport system permease protein